MRSTEVRQEVEQKQAKIVMIDSLSGYQLSIRGGDLLKRLQALGRYLQNMGVTVLLVNEIETITGDFQATGAGISYLADNITFMRHLKIQGKLRKAKFLEQKGYQTVGAASYSCLEKAIATSPHLALMDISGFDDQIWTHCQRLHHQNIPFLILASRNSPLLQQMSIEQGAKGILTKPLAPDVLLLLIHSLLES